MNFSKKSVLVPLSVLPLLASSAFAAGWTAPVIYMEASFGCKGLEADLSVHPAVNVALKGGPGGEYRLQARFDLRGKELFLVTPEESVRVGLLASEPTCTPTDAGEPPRADWTPIQIADEPAATLTMEPDPHSCRPDTQTAEGGYLRTVHYTFATAGGPQVSYPEEVHSPQACANMDVLNNLSIFDLK